MSDSDRIFRSWDKLAKERERKVDKMATAPTENVWLIEDHRRCFLAFSGTGNYWIDDAFEAVRFARKEDAERVAMYALGVHDINNRPYRIVEHIFD